MTLSDFEVQVLYDFLSHEWIHYEKQAMREIMLRLRKANDDIEFENELSLNGKDEDELD